MGQQPRDLTPGRSAAHLFGAELRRWRQSRGYSLARLAPLVLSSTSTLNHLELATRPADENVVRLCDEVLGAAGELLQLYAQIRDQENQVAESWEQPSLRFRFGGRNRRLRKGLAGQGSDVVERPNWGIYQAMRGRWRAACPRDLRADDRLGAINRGRGPDASSYLNYLNYQRS